VQISAKFARNLKGLTTILTAIIQKSTAFGRLTRMSLQQENIGYSTILDPENPSFPSKVLSVTYLNIFADLKNNIPDKRLIPL
jgi:hypothetical protein